MSRARAGALVAVALLLVVLVATAALVAREGGADRGSVSAGAGRVRLAGPASTVVEASTTAPPTTAPRASSTAVPAVPGRPLAGRIVAVDPGHNGRNANAPTIDRPVDAGGFRKACNTTGTATDGGISESSVNWAIALEVRSGLQDLGATVFLSRQDDRGVGPCIDERAAVANRAGADVLLSIHADGAASGAVGFHVIRPGMVRGYTEDIAGASSTLATTVRDALVAGGLRPSTYAGRDGLVTRTDLGTLNRSDVPACMVELGNLRDAAEAATLTSPAGQRRAAAALVAGVLSWLSRPPAEREGPPPSETSPPGTAKE